ncbi:prolyl-tRNA synthetase associated domain-containing protein [uncultured Flavonifractor sp.]|uniref:prolyl-tRNA synthetase associated domain-containing protein n=1 Tax=uncultured Flavonifractor sp. TaxID=1193534 RepID=UPI0026106573|nr:prolyl-tRNA synthetase associated domain-containing protein [uncultured Flavonifractor sp.]
MYVNPELYSAPPAEARDPREMAVYAFLDGLGIPYLRCDHDGANTMEDCKAVEAVLGVPICKNLLLTNRKQTDFYLLMLPGDKPFKTKDVTAQLGCARLSFATAEQMQALLGAAPGSASAFELIHDQSGKVRLVMDRELLAGESISGHPCFSTSTLRVGLRDFLERFLPAVGHVPTVVDLPWPD